MPRPSIVTTPGYLLYKAGVIAQGEIDRTLDAVQLSPRQFLLLGFVDVDELSQQDVARRLGLDPTIVGSVVDELEARGLLRRDRHEADRRRYVLSLTRSGRTLLRRAERLAEQSQRGLLAPLDPDEACQLAELLERVVTPHLVWTQGED